ncbi:thiamine pyrophosphokinase [Aspergillus ambiguus]|uniref:thiamine diphosphokinase n=1 Tax=Aspergillus ambiguus TaxID=176160 RepID=UPI003CCD2C06
MQQWDPTQFFRSDGPPRTPFALVILNQPINERAFAVVKKHACVTVCADGGANRFYQMMQAHGQESTELPSLIIGDLDSIHADTRAHYERLGVSVIEDSDQYSTDFTKCLNYIRRHAGSLSGPSPTAATTTTTAAPPRLDILILGGLGGRVDQAFSQIHHLYLMAQQQQQQQPADSTPGDLYLISEESITFILKPGRNVIHTPRANRPGGPCADSEEYLLEENVGIIPLAGPGCISTRGFQWDVEEWPTAIGGQLSTSNHIRAEELEITTRGAILLTLELARRFKRAR